MSDINSFSEQFRPKRPIGLYGEYQRKLAENLLNRVDSGKYPQVVLFCGPTGIGKTTIAYMYAAKILGQYAFNENDVFFLNCGNNTGIDSIREVIDNLSRGTLLGEKSVFYLDEIHRLSDQAQQALLTPLEPVPEHVIFMASTTNPEKIVKTLRDRFKVYNLPIPPKEEFIRLGTDVFKVLKKPIDLELINQVYDSCQGSVRVFQENLQEAIEGVFSPHKLDIEDETKLPNILFYQNLKLQALFQAVSKEKDYVGTLVGLCNYAIVVLSNPNSKTEQFRRAQIILHIMGDGIGKGMIEERITFYQKLLKVYAEINSR